GCRGGGAGGAGGGAGRGRGGGARRRGGRGRGGGGGGAGGGGGGGGRGRGGGARRGRGGRGRRRGRAAPPWGRDLEREGPARSAVPVDDDEIRLPRGHRRRDAGGAEQATRVDTRIVVAPDLGPARAHSAAQVED